MEKKPTKTFRQYAQRWREEVTQIDPPLNEKVMTFYFVETLRAPFYDKLLGKATRNFADLVMYKEMIENAIKNGKLEIGGTFDAGAERVPINESEEVQALTYERQPMKGFTIHRPPHPTMGNIVSNLCSSFSSLTSLPVHN